MIGKLKGCVDEIRDDHIILYVGGVGYIVHLAQTSLLSLRKGAELELFIDMQVKENSINLFGFGNQNELFIFQTLNKISGIGGKVALAIMSSMDSKSLCNAVFSKDSDAFTRVPGIGKKTAERVVLELGSSRDFKNKVSLEETFGEKNIIMREVEDALSGLGFSGGAIKKTMQICNEKYDAQSTSELLKKCLANIKS